MELFLVRILLYSVQIQKNTEQKYLHIWTLFTQWKLGMIVTLVVERIRRIKKKKSANLEGSASNALLKRFKVVSTEDQLKRVLLEEKAH